MSHSPQRSRTVLMVSLAIAALVGGILLAQFLPPDLLGLRGTSGEGITEEHRTEDPDRLWTCGMHPHVIEHEPGQCPICGMDLTPMRGNGSQGERAADTATGEPLFYRNPMDPTVTSPVPAQDSMGMDYVPVYADAAEAGMDSGMDSGTDGGMESRGAPPSNVVRVDPAMVQNMNVRTAAVGRRNLTQPIRTVGYLDFDQQRMVTVTTKYSGWVEQVYVNYVGEEVRRGQPLFEIYSPELVQTQRELLSALDFAAEMREAPADALSRAESMVESARLRLGYWDIAPRQIASLEETGEVFRTLKVNAPSSGMVMKRMPGLQGMAVQPGMELFHLADLRSLWLSVELFEGQLEWVREGTEADIELSYFPGETFTGKVRFIEPEVSETSRTLRARIEVPNPTGRLRKGMYATVKLNPVQVRDALVVPSQAVLRTGDRNVVVEALGEGRFTPREVVIGHEADGYAEILSGLDEGTSVVTSAQFLLDSESTLREAVQKMIGERGSAAMSKPVSKPALEPPSASGQADHADHNGQADHSGH